MKRLLTILLIAIFALGIEAQAKDKIKTCNDLVCNTLRSV